MLSAWSWNSTTETYLIPGTGEDIVEIQIQIKFEPSLPYIETAIVIP